MTIKDQLLLPLFATSYYIAKENLAVLKYESLKRLMDFVNVEQNDNYNS